MTNFILDMLFGSSSIFHNELYEEGIIDEVALEHIYR